MSEEDNYDGYFLRCVNIPAVKYKKNHLPKKQNTHIIRLASTIFYTRESPSGKASAFQADIRGFESHLPLSLITTYQLPNLW